MAEEQNSNNDLNRWRLSFTQRMLMRAEMDRVFQKYRRLSSSPATVITVEDVVLKLMMEEEINAIKMKYLARMSSDLENQNSMEVDEGGASTTGGASAPAGQQRNASAEKPSTCRRKLNF